MEFIENSLTYEQYTELRASVGWNNGFEQQTKNALANSTYTISVIEEDKIIAMARLVGDGMYYLVLDVVVRPDFQKKGIGTAVVNKLLQYIESNLPEGGRVSVQGIAEKGKESFYEKMGFKRVPHEYCGSGMRKVIHGK